MIRKLGALALALGIPACGGGGSGGGGAFVPFVVYLADAETDEVRELYAADVDGQTRKLSGPLAPGGQVDVFSWSPDRSRLVFLADKDVDGLHQLYAVPPDGSAPPTRISPAGKVAFMPNWSPDGAHLAFPSAAAPNGMLDLHVWSAAGLVTIARTGSVWPNVGVVWAPDGARLAFSAQIGPGLGLYTARPDGSELTQLPASTGRFAWSGDGARLIVPGLGNPGQALYSIPPGGGTPLRLTAPQLTSFDISYVPAPNGDRVVYFSWEEQTYGGTLYSVKTDGSGKVRVAPKGDALLPRFAPDGSGLVFHVQPNWSGGYQLWSCGPLGENGVSLGSVSGAGWAPDGSRLAFISDERTDEVYELFVVRPDGQSRTRVSAPLIGGGDVGWSAFNHFPDPYRWSPDGARLAYLADQEIDGVVELYCVAPDGSALVKVSGPLVAGGDVGLQEYPFQWAGDAASLVYQADQDVDGVFELYRGFPNGAAPVKLSGRLHAFADSGAFAVR